MANELVVQSEETVNAVSTKLDNFNSVEDVMSLAKHLIASKALPAGYNTPEKVLVGIQRSKELGMSPLAGMANLPMINGIPSPTVHLLVAKAREIGIMFTILKDFEKVFEPVLDAFGEPVIEEDKPKLKADVITTVKVSQFKHGRWFDNDISFRWSEAVSAELTTKDNWKKMPRIMMRSRALSLAARFAAPEATLGLMSAEEMSDIHNVQYTPSEVTI